MHQAFNMVVELDFSPPLAINQNYFFAFVFTFQMLLA